jgi:hypothetical protein
VEGSGRVVIWVIFHHLPGGTEENHEFEAGVLELFVVVVLDLLLVGVLFV